MFEINSFVIYGGNGVCKIIGKRKDSLCGTDKEYYVLVPLGSKSSVIFVPVDNPSLLDRMQELLDRDEILGLISSLKFNEVEWEKDSRKRAELFGDILSRGDRKEILTLIRNIYLKKKKLSSEGKRLSVSDESVLKRAEKLINDEFGVALGIRSDEVPAFIRRTIEEAI